MRSSHSELKRSPSVWSLTFRKSFNIFFVTLNTLRGECSVLSFTHAFVIIKYHWSRKHIFTIINNYKEMDINISILG